MTNELEGKEIMKFRYSRKDPRYLPKYILTLLIFSFSLYLYLFDLPISTGSFEKMMFQLQGVSIASTEALAVSLGFVGLVYVLLVELKRFKISYIVTNISVIEKKGFMKRTKNFLNLSKVNDIEIKQGILDRILSTGSVEMRTHSSALLLEDVPKPEKIEDTIMDLINKEPKSQGHEIEKFRVPEKNAGVPR